jgi:cell division protein FtsB
VAVIARKLAKVSLLFGRVYFCDDRTAVFRWVSLALLLVLASLQIKLWVSGGMREVWRLEKAVADQTAENKAQNDKNAQLSAEVEDLKDGAEAVEERARSELGMVKNDEVFYQVIESDLSAPPRALAGFTASEAPTTHAQR